MFYLLLEYPKVLLLVECSIRVFKYENYLNIANYCLDAKIDI